MAIGQASAMIPLTPVNEFDEEADETVVLTIEPSANYALGTTTEATVTILDDDAAPIITIAQPLRTTVFIPPGVGLLVRAEASRVIPGGGTESLTASWSLLSGPGTATFDGGLAGSTGVKFSANGTYVLRASTTYGPTTVTKDVTVGVGTPLTNGTVGTTTAVGSVTEDADGTITITGAGSGLSSTGTSDGFHFVATPLTGDFDISVQVVSVTNPGASTSCRVGIMARASSAAGAPYAMSLHRSNGQHGFQARLTASADPYDNTSSTQYTFPRWIRLVRTGDSFSAYYSDDGTAWTQRGATQTIPAMGPAPLVGLAVTSAVQATASTAVFDKMSLALPVNKGPLVDAGPSLAATGPWTLDGTITDDALPAPSSLSALWQYRSGPVAPVFASASFADTDVSFSESGTYILRLTATDGVVTTFDETSGSVTAGLTPFEAWRAEKFGADANNPAIAGDLVDPELDGIANLLEYAMDLEPRSPSQGLLPTISLDADTVYFTWRKRKSATDITVSVLTSLDFAGWAPATPVNTIISDNGQVQVIQSALPRTESQMFIRLSVERASE
jgi:hypothetical protein